MELSFPSYNTDAHRAFKIDSWYHMKIKSMQNQKESWNQMHIRNNLLHVDLEEESNKDWKTGENGEGNVDNRWLIDSQSKNLQLSLFPLKVMKHNQTQIFIVAAGEILVVKYIRKQNTIDSDMLTINSGSLMKLVYNQLLTD